jgi:hypothetical protein
MWYRYWMCIVIVLRRTKCVLKEIRIYRKNRCKEKELLNGNVTAYVCARPAVQRKVKSKEADPQANLFVRKGTVWSVCRSVGRSVTLSTSLHAHGNRLQACKISNSIFWTWRANTHIFFLSVFFFVSRHLLYSILRYFSFSVFVQLCAPAQFCRRTRPTSRSTYLLHRPCVLYK